MTGEILFYGFLFSFAMFFGDIGHKLLVAYALLIGGLLLVAPLLAGIVIAITTVVFYWTIGNYKR